MNRVGLSIIGFMGNKSGIVTAVGKGSSFAAQIIYFFFP